MINRSSTAEGRTSIGNGNFLHEGVHVSHDRGSETIVYLVMAVRFPEMYLGRLRDLRRQCIDEPRIRVGSWAMIQTGCRFRKDIPPFIVAAKEPTTYYGVNSFIMSHEGFSEKVIKHISHAYRIIFQGNSSLTDALLMIKDQVPMSKEIQHIIDFVGESKLGIIK